MSDEPIDFSDAGMFPAPKPKAPVRQPTPSVFSPAEIRAVCEREGIAVTAEPRRMEKREGVMGIEWAVGEIVVREHVGGQLYTGEGRDRRCLMYGRPATPIADLPPLEPRCPFCSQVKSLTHTRSVWSNQRSSSMTFCSSECGTNYQMGCEG